MATTPKIYDNAAMNVQAAPGTGSITLGIAEPGFQSFADAGAQDGETVSYSIRDAADQWEIGQGLYSAVGPTLTRSQIYSSSNSGGPINASVWAKVFITATSYDTKVGRVPAGGSTGKLLVKNSPSDYDVSWGDGELVAYVANNMTGSMTGNLTFTANVTHTGANAVFNGTQVSGSANAAWSGTNAAFLVTNLYSLANATFAANVSVSGANLHVTATNTDIGNVTMTGLTTLAGNVTIAPAAKLVANGVSGGAGQVLASTGSNVYWTNPSSLSGTNTDATFTWTNTHTFQNVVTHSGNVVASGGNLYVTATNTTIGNATLSGSVLSVGANATMSANVSLTGANVYSSAANNYFSANVTVGGNAVFSGANVYFSGKEIDAAANAIFTANVSVSGSNLYVTSTNTSLGNVTMMGVANVANNLTVGNTLFINTGASNIVANATNLNLSNATGNTQVTPYGYTVANSTASHYANIGYLYVANTTQNTVVQVGNITFSNSAGANSFMNTMAVVIQSNVGGGVNAVANLTTTLFNVGNSTSNLSYTATTLGTTANVTVAANVTTTGVGVYVGTGTANAIVNTTAVTSSNSTGNGALNPYGYLLQNSTASHFANIGYLYLANSTQNTVVQVGNITLSNSAGANLTANAKSIIVQSNVGGGVNSTAVVNVTTVYVGNSTANVTLSGGGAWLQFINAAGQGYGSAGQFLLSNGSSNVYWATVTSDPRTLSATVGTTGSISATFTLVTTTGTTQTLPDATSATAAGRTYVVKSASGVTTTIATTSSQQIDGASSGTGFTIAPLESYSYTSNGTSWSLT